MGLLIVVLLASVGCSGDGDGGQDALQPKSADALRIAAAMQDPILVLDVPLVTLGQPTTRPYICADGTTCQPAVGQVRRLLARNGPARAQVAKFYLDKLAPSGWFPDDVFCDEATDEFVVLANKNPQLESTYPARLEVRLQAVEQVVITVPAFGTERDFTVRPADADYPSGSCPEVLTTALAAAVSAADLLGAPPAAAAPAPSPTTAPLPPPAP